MAKATHEAENEAIRQIVEIFQKLPTCEQYKMIGYAQAEFVRTKESRHGRDGTCR